METILLFLLVVIVMMNPWLIPLVIIIWFIGSKLKKKYDGSDYGRKQKVLSNQRIVKRAEELTKKLNSSGVYPTYIVEHNVSHIYIDENNRKIFLQLLYEDVVLNFDDIVRYEIITETGGNLQYTLGTAVTGKFQQNVTVSSIFVYIYLNSIDRPFVKVLCLGNGTNYNQSSMEVYNANEFANKLIGALDYIKSNTLTKPKPVLNLIPNLQTEFVPSEKKVKSTKKKTKKNKDMNFVTPVDEQPVILDDGVIPVDDAEIVVPVEEVKVVEKKSIKKEVESNIINNDNELSNKILAKNEKLKEELAKKQKEIEELQRKLSKAERNTKR